MHPWWFQWDCQSHTHPQSFQHKAIYRNLGPRINHVSMNTYPWTIINGCNFITWIGYESRYWMALTLASWTCIYMNSTRTQLEISYQCMLGLFGTTKFLKSSYKLSYSSIWRPTNKLCIIGFICTIFQFPSPTSLFTCAKIDLKPLIQFHVLQVNAIMCNVFPTFLHHQLWHIPHYNITVLVFCQCVPFTTNDFFFVLNQWKHFTLHHIYRPSLKQQAPCPWHANCPFNLEFASAIIKTFFLLFLSFICFIQGGIKVGPSCWKSNNSTTLLLEMTWRSWTWWSLPWTFETIGTCKITHDKARPFSTIATKPSNVERPTKIRTGPSLTRVVGPQRVTRPTKTKA